MHIKYILPVFILVTLLSSCAGMMPRPGTAEEELASASARLNRDRSCFDSLNSINYPGSGYFYILDMHGKVLMHPEKALCGMDFSRYDFVKKILVEKKGCLTFTSGSRIINLFYTALDNGDILCFSFESAPGINTYKECR